MYSLPSIPAISFRFLNERLLVKDGYRKCHSANLFKGQEADAVAKMRDMMISDQHEVIRATGTDDRIILKDGGDQSACAARETWHTGAKCCDGQSPPPAQEESLKPVQIADLSDVVRDDALASESAP